MSTSGYNSPVHTTHTYILQTHLIVSIQALKTNSFVWKSPLLTQDKGSGSLLQTASKLGRKMFQGKKEEEAKRSRRASRDMGKY